MIRAPMATAEFTIRNLAPLRPPPERTPNRQKKEINLLVSNHISRSKFGQVGGGGV